jgi:hypothetical protein
MAEFCDVAWQGITRAPALLAIKCLGENEKGGERSFATFASSLRAIE